MENVNVNRVNTSRYSYGKPNISLRLPLNSSSNHIRIYVWNIDCTFEAIPWHRGIETHSGHILENAKQIEIQLSDMV